MGQGLENCSHDLIEYILSEFSHMCMFVFLYHKFNSSMIINAHFRASSFDQKLFLRALLVQLNEQGNQFPVLKDVIYTMIDICKMDSKLILYLNLYAPLD